MRSKALAEIYTMHSFAPFSNLIAEKIAENFADFLQMFTNFAIVLLNFAKCTKGRNLGKSKNPTPTLPGRPARQPFARLFEFRQ